MPWLQRNPANGRIKRNPDNGLIKRGIDTNNGCCCGCANCDGSSPSTMQVTFADVTLRGCQNNSDPHGPDPDNCRYWYSAQVTAGDLNGTYCIARSPDDPCCYCADIGTMTLTFYDAANCAGNVLIVEADVFIQVCVTATGLTVQAYFRMEHAQTYLNGPYTTGLLFLGTLATATPCSVGNTVTNSVSGDLFDGNPPLLYLADDGTCLVTPDGCLVGDALDCGSLETQCPTDCSGCNNTYTAVVSGGGGGLGCATGTFVLTRSGCVWSDANTSQLLCSNGVWRLEINDGLGFGGCSRFMVEDDGSNCPPTVGWKSCEKCCVSLQTVTVS